MNCTKCGETIAPYEHSGVRGLCEACYYGEVGELVEGHPITAPKATGEGK